MPRRGSGPSIPSSVRAAQLRPSGEGDVALAVDLHPAATPVLISASDTGGVTVAGETVVAGPGYHRFVVRVLERLGRELGIDWADDDSSLLSADRASVERSYLAWLGPQLARARVATHRGELGIHLGLPTGTRFTTDAAILTVMGPRDDAWLDAAIADPRVALDITPWWADATDGRYLLNRALVLMWRDVRWRAPAVEGEAALLDEVHRLLSRAYPDEPSLDYPWHAWAQVCAFRGINDAMSRQAAARASREPEPTPAVGYRRDPVRITHEGWSLEIPGSYAERRSADEYWAGGAGRSVTLAATRTGMAGGGAMPAQMFVDQFAADLGPDALNHRAGELVGRARLTTDTSTAVEVGVLEGYSAIRGSGAVVRIEFDDPADWQWAVETWRALAPG